MVRVIAVLLAAALLAGCSNNKVTSSSRLEKDVDAAQVITNKRFNELAVLPEPHTGKPIPIAVYRFTDLTGQRKPSNNFASLSSAVTQGAETLLIKALQDAGGGKWFQPLERVGLENLTRERQLIRSQREVYEKDQAKPLTPLIVAGIMGYLQIWIKPSTAVIFTIAFGIAVDDTIHFLARLKIEAAESGSLRSLIHTTLEKTGRSMILTSVILIAGFGTLTFSDFESTQYMGYLVSLTIGLALVTDLLFLPALMYWIKPTLTKE